MVRAAGLALLMVLAVAAPAAAAPSTVMLGTFASPTWAGAPASEPSRVCVTERVGRVRVIVDGVVQATPFLDLTGITESGTNERGLLSAAFGPDYATAGRFYVYMTAKSPVGQIQIWQFQRSANPNVANSSGKLLLAIDHAQAGNHNGGQVQVGPDGKVWLATGDGGGSNNQYAHAQNPASRLGKLLRVDQGATPVPTVEQLAQGLRNPWRFSFTPAGEIVIADVGQGTYEEVNVGLAANYGWPCREGMHDYRTDSGCVGVPLKDPVLEKTHGGDLFCSITGGHVVRDPGLPTLVGRYIYGDFCAAPLRSFALNNPAGEAAVGISVQSLSSFGEDACGRVLVVSLNGPVYRLVDGIPTPCGGPTPTPTPTPTPSPTPTPTPTGAPSPTPTPTATPFATASPAPAPTPSPSFDASRAPDLRPCTVSMRVTGLASLGRRHYLSVALRTDEACRATISGRITSVTNFRTTAIRLEPGTRTLVRLRVTNARAVTRALRSRSRAVSLRVEARDAAGNPRTLTESVRAKR